MRFLSVIPIHLKMLIDNQVNKDMEHVNTKHKQNGNDDNNDYRNRKMQLLNT